MIRNLQLRTKLGVGFGLIILIAILLGAVAVLKMSQVRTTATDMAEERLPAVEIANLVERSSLLAMYEIRGYTLAEEAQYLSTGLEHIREVEEALERAFTLAGAHGIDALRTQAEAAKNAIHTYKNLVKQSEADIAKMKADRVAMGQAAESYMKTCDHYLDAMETRLKQQITASTAASNTAFDGKAIEESMWQIHVCNDVIETGNIVRIANWKAQATRHPKDLQEGLESFKVLDGLLDSLKAKTAQEDNLQQIEACRQAGHAYALALRDFLKTWTDLQELGVKRGEAATEVLKAAQASAMEAISSTKDGANTSVTALSNASVILVIGLISAALIGIALAVIITRGITGPVQSIRASLGSVAGGDLTVRSTVDQKDEVGEMAGALNSTVEGLRTMIGGINQNAQGIAGAAEELSAISKQLTGNAGTSSNQAGQAAAAAAQVSASISAFATGVEEMGATVGEIAKNAGQAASVALEGVAVVKEANAVMTRLGTSSNEIGDIIKVITSIAEQTNLLALNATIEAARAGETGRGFAVVAGEVKDLARKTAEATGDISKRVTGLQDDSLAARDALARISTIVDKINDLQQTIATAVEEQSATAKEMGSNVTQVAQAGSDIARNVTAVADAAKEASSGAGETLKAATELARLAADLRLAVSRFRT